MKLNYLNSRIKKKILIDKIVGITHNGSNNYDYMYNYENYVPWILNSRKARHAARNSIKLFDSIFYFSVGIDSGVVDKMLSRCSDSGFNFVCEIEGNPEENELESSFYFKSNFIRLYKDDSIFGTPIKDSSFDDSRKRLWIDLNKFDGNSDHCNFLFCTQKKFLEQYHGDYPIYKDDIPEIIEYRSIIVEFLYDKIMSVFMSESTLLYEIFKDYSKLDLIKTLHRVLSYYVDNSYDKLTSLLGFLTKRYLCSISLLGSTGDIATAVRELDEPEIIIECMLEYEHKRLS